MLSGCAVSPRAPDTLLSLCAPVCSGEVLSGGGGHGGSLKRGAVPPTSLLDNGAAPAEPTAAPARPLATSLPGSPSAAAPPPAAEFPSPTEPRKLSLQADKKPGGFLTGFKKTLRSRKTETSLLYAQAEVRTGCGGGRR